MRKSLPTEQLFTFHFYFTSNTSNTPTTPTTSAMSVTPTQRKVSTSSSLANSSSIHSSGRKSFINKILRRRLDSLQESVSDHTDASPDTSLASATRRRRRRSQDLSRNTSVRRSAGTGSSFSPPSIFDDDESPVYDYDNESIDGLSQTSSILTSDTSLKAEKVTSNLHENIPSFLDGLGNDIWLGLKYEALVSPQFTRVTRKNKHSPRGFYNLFLAQELNSEASHDDVLSDESDTEASGDGAERTPKNNTSEVFVMEFSPDGKYLAVAGRDSVIKIWKVISSPLSRLEFDGEIAQTKDNTKRRNKSDRLFSHGHVFHPEPVKVFEGHTHSVLLLAWSKNNFLISGSMDRTARLWHVDRAKCLHTFQHEDFVTSVSFHPTDDRFFLSGSLDNELRLWLILERQVAFSKNLGNDVLITALAFTPDGQFCIAGGFNGAVFILETRGLHHVKHFEVKERGLVHQFHHKNGNKITGIKIYENSTVINNPGDTVDDPFKRWNVLITTNDLKVRLINTNSKKLVTRFKGLHNHSSSIVASMSPDHHFIISGSEDHWCYIWENNNYIINNKLRLALKDLVLEGTHHIEKHKKYLQFIQDNKLMKKLNVHQFLSDENHANEYVSNENSSYTCFHAHHLKVNAAIFAPEATCRLLDFSDDVILDLAKRGKAFDAAEKGTDPEEVDYGHIIVTTDQYGLIRVFRQDVAARVRKRLLEVKKGKQCDRSKSLDNKLAPKNSNLRIDLSNTPKMTHMRSLSPSAETSFSLKDKIHNKLKKAGTRRPRADTSASGTSSLSPAGPRPDPFDAASGTEAAVPQVVSSSSLIKLRQGMDASATDMGPTGMHLDIDNADASSGEVPHSSIFGDSTAPTSANSNLVHPSPKVPLIISTTTGAAPEVIDFVTPTAEAKEELPNIDSYRGRKR